MPLSHPEDHVRHVPEDHVRHVPEDHERCIPGMMGGVYTRHDGRGVYPAIYHPGMYQDVYQAIYHPILPWVHHGPYVADRWVHCAHRCDRWDGKGAWALS